MNDKPYRFKKTREKLSEILEYYMDRNQVDACVNELLDYLEITIKEDVK